MSVDLDQIQGNIFGGFNKDYQDFLFLTVVDAAEARARVRTLSSQIATSRQVLAFNNEFKTLKSSGIARPDLLIQARWVNLAFSASGLSALGLTVAEHGVLPQAFTDGMAHRHIGDEGPSAPGAWLAPFTPNEQPNIHAVVLLAADTAADLASLSQSIRANLAGAFVIAGTIEGRTRDDERGHEHFGFKDGISQPGVRGVDVPVDPIANPDQGNPGQDLLWPGEFVLGYPTQIPHAKPGHDGPNPDPGTPRYAGKPAWTDNGSFLVFRRLEQDVPGFNASVEAFAHASGLHVDLAGAKLVGRYKSGCPLETLKFRLPAAPSSTDPSVAQPARANDPTLNNAFEYGDDPNGTIVPLAAHIRKVYPRDEVTPVPDPDDSESETQTHRLIRRGIPYGRSLHHGPEAERRGLLFLAYQNDIESHFEFVQTQWSNAPTFPPSQGNAPGVDPIIAQSPEGPFPLARGLLRHFVKTTGGEYFFAPSIKTLQTL